MNNKEKYRLLCENEKSIPIFSQAWWLDSVSEDLWDVCLFERNGQILGSMPFVMKKKLGFTLLTHPPLTQNLGPWIKPQDGKYSKILGAQKDILEELINELPDFHYLNQNWHYLQKNWLPFYWNGFKQTTRYTYVFNDLSDINSIVANFEHSKRKNINKSEQIIKIVFDISAEEFYDNHRLTLSKQGETISYPYEIFKKIYDNGYSRNNAKTIAAYDSNGNLHAALFIVWDQMSAYNLISTIDPDYRVYGAASLLVREALVHCSNYVDKFDFEGSMIESVERSFRQFGAIQTPYFAISQSRSFFISLYMCLNDYLRTRVVINKRRHMK